MAATISTIAATNPVLLSLNVSGAGVSVPRSVFMGKKVRSRFNNSHKLRSGSFKVVAAKEIDEGMVDPLFQAPNDDGTSAYEYINQGPPTFEEPNMTLDEVLEDGKKLVDEQENDERVHLADKYLNEAAPGEANEDSIKRGALDGKEAQQSSVPVPEGSTDPNDEIFDPTDGSDDGNLSTHTF